MGLGSHLFLPAIISYFFSAGLLFLFFHVSFSVSLLISGVAFLVTLSRFQIRFCPVA